MSLLLPLLQLVFTCFCTFLASSTIMIWWFTTDFPVHLTKLVRWLGYRKHEKDFWPEGEHYDFWYRTHWQNWLQTTDVPNLLKSGLICPGCMSLHASYIAGAIVALVMLPLQSWLISLVAFLLSCLIVPAPALMAHELLKVLRVYTKRQSEPPLAR